MSEPVPRPIPRLVTLREAFIPRIVQQAGQYQVQLSFGDEGCHLTGPVRKTVRGAIKGWNAFAVCLLMPGTRYGVQVPADEVKMVHYISPPKGDKA